ncbi:relaxase/mobilization nuclease domain-containing protein [uncultured Chitinophaga sp.]|uniref:relaxase/mobilization nuclease domain-containing protein n=1 Tax=uncultured Chitinophaga sp. TaxID=339340 RepID=UPI0025E4E9B5|nr:relaxase/mobilization nuclease domain-containing protein [uncultured Chitinophaga sp.]
MISKVITGKSFSGCCRYVCKPVERAEILYVHGVRESDPKQMAEDFEQNRRLLPNKHRAVFHGILSFHPDDKVTNELMATLAQKYLQEIGLINTQVAVVKHTDKAHPHLHIIANLVNLNGKAISDSWLGLRGSGITEVKAQNPHKTYVLCGFCVLQSWWTILEFENEIRGAIEKKQGSVLN